MKNIGAMMKQAQEMQSRLNDMQSRLGDIEIDGVSGAGLVQITLNGKGEARRLKLDPKAVDPAEIEMLEDLILAAINDAKAKIDAKVATETESIMGGLKLPAGFKLPF